MRILLKPMPYYNLEQELAATARKILNSASDPISAVIKFLQERPENDTLAGYVIKYVLNETFGSEEQIPGLIKVFTKHVRAIIRQSNVINIVKEYAATEKWGDYVIKQAERVKFEIGKEKGLLVLKEISGIFALEHGIELPLEKITVQPPKLIVSVRLGIFRPNRVIDILNRA
jgi:hypothetical protein